MSSNRYVDDYESAIDDYVRAVLQHRRADADGERSHEDRLAAIERKYAARNEQRSARWQDASGACGVVDSFASRWGVHAESKVEPTGELWSPQRLRSTVGDLEPRFVETRARGERFANLDAIVVQRSKRGRIDLIARVVLAVGALAIAVVYLTSVLI